MEKHSLYPHAGDWEDCNTQQKISRSFGVSEKLFSRARSPWGLFLSVTWNGVAMETKAWAALIADFAEGWTVATQDGVLFRDMNEWYGLIHAVLKCLFRFCKAKNRKFDIVNELVNLWIMASHIAWSDSSVPVKTAD